MLLIDGHNLIGKLPNISLSDPEDEAKLIVVLRNYYTLNPREKIQVVFDAGSTGGQPGMSSGGSISVRYAARGSTADAVIIKQLREDHDPRQFTVVSSDNEVRNVARGLGAGVLSSTEFANKLSTHSPKRGGSASRKRESGDKPLNPDVDYWLTQFKRKR